MRSREMFFSPWQAADYTGLKVEAIYELLASGKSPANKSMGAGGSGNPCWMPGSTPR
jgi:predicted DNA-binding transcriptional regulator AlpA